MMMGGGMCPMKVPGATVSATDVEGGVAVAFTTSSGDVAELQRRVHHLADMHGHHQAQHQERMSHDPMNATATAEDIEGGTRIVLRPADASQLDELRRHAHAHAEMMAAHGDCPMQEGHAHGEERP